MNDAIRMQISAFVDGELPDNEADLLLRRMGQDAELRKKVAEYIAIGRALRGEMFVPGVDRIHERVSAAIDDKPFEEEIETAVTPPAKALRPLAGIAIAATVALVAIFALQQTMSVNGTDPQTPEGVVAEVDTAYTVPQQMDDQLRQYFLSHGAIATENGANSINSRIVSLRLSEEALDESVGEDDVATDDEADEEPTRP
jgi:sigma-E factor negative regulatory protein RseA